MALKQITGEDLKSSRSFKDIGMAFSRNASTDDVGVVKNDNAIKQALRNLILTTPGEKPFDLLVGCRVREMLFEPLDPFVADAIRDEIINTIGQFEPRVQLVDVAVQAFPDGNKLAVTVEYQIVGIPIVETVNFILQRPT
tara:strand:+ start:1843 stop:2262 length:420 start_codon:yes stop_codon:yes gene_type:complete